jgi:hypothetical protein
VLRSAHDLIHENSFDFQRAKMTNICKGKLSATEEKEQEHSHPELTMGSSSSSPRNMYILVFSIMAKSSGLSSLLFIPTNKKKKKKKGKEKSQQLASPISKSGEPFHVPNVLPLKGKVLRLGRRRGLLLTSEPFGRWLGCFHVHERQHAVDVDD